MTTLIAHARSFLFVPASRPERFAKAMESGAGCVILDLEDAVPPEQKRLARANLEVELAKFDPALLARTLVRINAAGSPWQEDDLQLIRIWIPRGLAGVMVPKAETTAAIQRIGASLGGSTHIVPLVESLAGLDAVDLLASAPQVTRLAFGHLDFQLDLGMRCGAEETELAPARFALVAASRRARLPPPIDGVTVDTSNVQRLRDDAQRARALGFGAKLCIHPLQVKPVEETFHPSQVEIDWARRVLSAATAHQGSAFSLDGRMVDLPVIRLAEQTLLHAESLP